MKTLRIMTPMFLVLSTACSAGSIGVGTADLAGESSGTLQSPNVTAAAGDANTGSTAAPGCPTGQQPNGFTGGPSICCSGSFALCDDFETEAVGQSPNATWWQMEKLISGYGLTAGQAAPANSNDANGIIEITDKFAARGKHSLHVYAPNDGWHHDMVVNRTIFPAPSNTFWGRAFIYFNSTVPGGHSTYADASGTLQGKGTTYLRISTFPHMAINYWGGDQTFNSNNIGLPTNTWACMEWEYAGATNEVNLYLNGDLIASVPSSANIAAPAYDTFRIGWETYSYQYNPTPPNFDMYYDEIALDYMRVGCDK